MSSGTDTDKANEKVSLPTLTAMVVGSMIGAGVFLLPRRFGAETGVLGAVIAWTVAGAGMLMLAFVFLCVALGLVAPRLGAREGLVVAALAGLISALYLAVEGLM